jgi:hypothetical protein
MTNPATRCESCGEENDFGSAFCTGCGAALAAAPARPAAPVSPPASSPPPRRAVPVVPLVVAGVIALAAIAWFVLQGNGGGGGNLVTLLGSSPLPAASYQGWKVRFPPEVAEDDEPEPGQAGLVMAHLDRGSDQGTAGFSFTVFQSTAQARASYDASSRHDQEGHPGFTADQLADIQARVVRPPGLTATCLRGEGSGTCHALAGRTLVFVFMDRDGVDAVIRATSALVDHVAALDK